MDEVLAKTLKANLKAAKTPETKLDAVVLAMISVVDCQHRTAARVKWLRTSFLLLAVAILVLTTAGPETLKEMITLSKGGV
jgi:hypothetical protein